MSLQFIVIFLLLKYCQCHEGKIETISVITDFLNLQQAPTKIYAMLCWDKPNNNLLLKKLIGKYQINLQTDEIPNYHFNDHQTFLLDLECDNAKQILEMASRLHLFGEFHKWILLGNSSDLMWDANFGIGSAVWLLEKEKVDGSFEIKAVYKNAENRMEDCFVSWNAGQFSEHREYSISRNRTNLKGTSITISYVITNNDSLNHMWDYRYKHIDVVTKVNYILLHYLTDYMNATRKFILQSTWGYKNDTTDIFSGMMGDLQMKLADVGGTASFITSDRIGIIGYLDSTPSFAKIILRAPPLSYATNVFTLPFDKTVWYCCFALIPIIAVALLVIVKWELSDPIFSEKIKDELFVLRPRDVVMLEVGAVTQQGTEIEPKSYAGRIATICTLVALMFLYTSYSANIVALLQSTTNSIRSLEDLLNSRIRVGVNDISYGHYYFETATEPIRKAIYEQKVAPKGQKPNFMEAEAGMRKVQQGFFGFYVELSTGYQLVSNIFQESEKCSLREIEYVNMMEPWIPYPKDSSYKEIMKVGMRKIREVGVKQREVRRLYVRKPACVSGGSSFGSVGLIDCYSAFLIFIIGVAISVVLLMLEIGFKKWSMKKSETCSPFKGNKRPFIN